MRCVQPIYIEGLGSIKNSFSEVYDGSCLASGTTNNQHFLSLGMR